jgi:hypothetical protein
VVDGELTAANLNLTQSFEPIAAVLGLTTEPFISQSKRGWRLILMILILI